MNMPDNDPLPPEPPQIRLLRRLVMALTVVLMLGMLIIVGLMVWRLGPRASAPILPELPAEIALPAGERLTGYAWNPDWTVLITADAQGTQRLHLLRPGGHEIRQTVIITAP